MATRKTWLWVLVGLVAAGLVLLIAAAGAGVYFVTHHIQSRQTTSAEALRAFDAVKATFGSARPLYQTDGSERPTLVRPLDQLPTSPRRPQDLSILAWNPDEQHLVRVSLPLWILQFGQRKMEMSNGAFDLQRLNLDVDELERIGPALVFDFRNREGVRVLGWTQ
jgi:hypothetical protein